MFIRHLSIWIMLATLISPSASAIMLGPVTADANTSQMDLSVFTFEDTAMADRLVSDTLESNDLQGPTVLRAISDERLTSYIDPDYIDDYVLIQFTDNAVRNGEGYDLAIFELWVPEAIRVSLSINDPGIWITPTYTGYKTTFNNNTTGKVNVAWLDLSDLGIGAGDLVTELLIGATGTVSTDVNNSISSPEIAAIAAIHNVPTLQRQQQVNVPEPASLGLLGIGLVGLFWGKHHRRLQRKG